MFTPSPFSKVYAAQEGEQVEEKSDHEGGREFHQTNGEDEAHPQLLQQSLDEAPAQSRELDQAQLKFLLKQVAINRRYDRWNYYLSYDFYKDSMKWFLDTATIDFSFSVSRKRTLKLCSFHVIVIALCVSLSTSLRPFLPGVYFYT